MKVYAEYFEESGLLFRKNTLLQFGDSWDLIGSVVLANPGSAEPLTKASEEVSTLVSEFYDGYREGELFNAENWYEFSADSTMRSVEKIFNGWYIGRNIEPIGVIQLFNTFNIKNQNLQEAVAQIGVDSELLFSYNVHRCFHDKPTYFGFSNKVLGNDVLRNVAMNIFNESSDMVRKIYNIDFSKNSFYHPMYINQAYNQKHFQKYKDNVLSAIVENA
jgi:hypothetical protein